MSFFDESDKPPRGSRRADRERRRPPDPEPRRRERQPPVSERRPPRRGRGTDRRTLLRRRVTILAIGLAFLILAGLLVRGCLDARKERAFEEYLQEASSLLAESQQESEALFELLESPGDSTAVDVQNTLNGLSVDSERLVERARAADPPNELTEAQGLIAQVIELRSVGLGGIADQIPPALGDEQRDDALEAIAADMQSLLASDVILEQQALPRIELALEEEDLTLAVEELPDEGFLADVEWLNSERVEEAVDEIPASEGDAEE